ncbi:MAG: hypothetical protein ACYS0K_09415 [Planctomycetota bacterium]|jgi:hypothetical protein
MCLASRAEAKPPESPQFARAKELLEKLEVRSERLKQEEEFKAKPREERLVLRFKEGAETFEGEELTGAYVIRAIMEWDRVRLKVTPDDVKGVLLLLPEAFKARYGFIYTKSKALRKQRRCASAHLVAALTHERRHVRKLAIECLDAMYGERHRYKVDAPEAERRRRQKEWRRALSR